MGARIQGTGARTLLLLSFALGAATSREYLFGG